MGIDKHQNSNEIEQVYNESYSRLFLFAVKKTGNEHIARDIVSDAFLRIMRLPEVKLHQLDSIEHYLFTVVRNSCTDYFRKQKTAETKLSEYRLQKGDNYQEDQHLWELSAKIDQGYKRMKPKTREIFKLSRLKGYSYREIAEEVGLSIKSVEVHISKALIILREELADYL